VVGFHFLSGLFEVEVGAPSLNPGHEIDYFIVCGTSEGFGQKGRLLAFTGQDRWKCWGTMDSESFQCHDDVNESQAIEEIEFPGELLFTDAWQGAPNDFPDPVAQRP
jgi:hypothetical protein